MTRTPGEFIVDALASVGVRPDDVTHVICTPLQLYTTSNLPLFRRAQVCLSKRGWIHYHTTHQHPHDHRWNSIPRDVLAWLCLDAWDQVRLLEDEDEIVPGIRTWWAGTHHRARLAVEVDTPAGVVVASDAFFSYANVEQNRMLGISESMAEGLRTYERARAVADHLVPLYDPDVFVRVEAAGVPRPASEDVRPAASTRTALRGPTALRHADRDGWQEADHDADIVTVRVRPGGGLRRSHDVHATFGALDRRLMAARIETEFVARRRRGGATLEVGSDHPVADALRRLDVSPRAFMTYVWHDGRATLMAPEPVGDARPYPCHPGLDVPLGRYTVRYLGTPPIDQYAAGDLRRDPMAFDTVEGSSPVDRGGIREDE